MPTRSPHVGGVPIAICDRCIGIYVGLVLGVAVARWGRGLWQYMGRWGQYLLLGSLVPMGVDWVGPVLGLWHNSPTSRAVTGLVFSTVAAGYVTYRLIRQDNDTPAQLTGTLAQ